MKALYKHLFPKVVSPNLPWKLVWKLDTFPKLQFFMWRLLLNKLPVKENLKHCNEALCALDITCVLCWETIVSTNHLFAKCHVSKSIWENLHPSIPRPHHSRSFYEWFRWKANNQNKKFASFLTWYTWKMRNLYILSYSQIHPQATLNKTTKAIYQWNMTNAFKQSLSLVGFTTST